VDNTPTYKPEIVTVVDNTPTNKPEIVTEQKPDIPQEETEEERKKRILAKMGLGKSGGGMFGMVDPSKVALRKTRDNTPSTDNTKTETDTTTVKPTGPFGFDPSKVALRKTRDNTPSTDNTNTNTETNTTKDKPTGPFGFDPSKVALRKTRDNTPSTDNTNTETNTTDKPILRKAVTTKDVTKDKDTGTQFKLPISPMFNLKKNRSKSRF
jgi:hypothetical protein